MTQGDLPANIAEASEWLTTGRVTSVALTEGFLGRIAQLNDQLSAFITVTADAALAEAAALDVERAQGRVRGPLHGIPYAAKDLFATRGVRTTAHSALLADFVPDFDAACVERMRDAGAVLLGKLAMHEFAFGGPAFDLPFPPARNPHDPNRVPGGSSSGSGVAVAAEMCLASLGSDTGGSIRSPAAACGVVGLKPTFGRVSRYGSVELAPSLDTCGPLTATVGDAETLLEALSGYDPRDPTTSNASPFRAEPAEAGARGMRIGIPSTLDELMPKLSAPQRQAYDSAIEALRVLDCEIIEVAPPEPALMFATSRAIIFAEAHAMHAARLRAIPEQYGSITRERLIFGQFVDASDYLAAKSAQPYLTELYERFFGEMDVLLMPATNGNPGRMDGERGGLFRNRVELPHGFNVTGHPVLTVPFGKHEGIPLAMQLIARRYSENLLFRAGRALEAGAREV
ncbi:MAG TPA: amidase [Devosiaceae bacterium]|jgi:aspartyl-tRNA(Asn)/glutamyl-tRNA(Gln) amidotransferase subunit A